MASKSKRQQTMAKRAREQNVKDKRAQKAEKRQAKRDGTWVAPTYEHDDTLPYVGPPPEVSAQLAEQEALAERSAAEPQDELAAVGDPAGSASPAAPAPDPAP